MESKAFHQQKKDVLVFYCPVCKVENRSFYWPNPRKRHAVQFLALSLSLGVLLWQWTGPKGFFLAIPFWAAFEVVYRLKARQSIQCRKCGFDPFLFKFDKKLAKKKVEEHFKAKKQALEPLSEESSAATSTEKNAET